MDKILSDKGTHYFVPARSHRGLLTRRRVQRFLCVGGPAAGAYRSLDEFVTEFPGVYVAFNNAGMSKHSMILVAKELLP